MLQNPCNPNESSRLIILLSRNNWRTMEDPNDIDWNPKSVTALVYSNELTELGSTFIMRDSIRSSR